MNGVKMLCLLLTLSFTVGAAAQGASSAPPAAAAKPTTPPAKVAPPSTIGGVIDREISIIEREFVGAAEAMPEEKYNFAPNGLNIAGSDFKGVRTFAEQVKHVAASNYYFWGPITGDKSPLPADSPNDNGPSALKTKAEIVKYLKDSFALGHKAAQSLSSPDAAMATVATGEGQQQPTKLFMASFGAAHCLDHYGQMVEYLRMNGIIPPASRGQ